MAKRIEKDLLGEMEIDESALWGIHTQRALANFNLSGYKISPRLISALALVKKACMLSNFKLGYIEEKKAQAILTACDEIINGTLNYAFILDALQGGAGTSINMNMNEVIANRALELLGEKKGSYKIIDPIETVNMHQSTNDVFPTALKIAAINCIRELSSEIASLQGELQKKEKEFSSIVKIGRTQMQDAVPITLGAEFGAFAEAFSRDRWRVFKCEERLRLVNIGGTAVGTALGAPRKYVFLVIEELRKLSGFGLARGENLLDQTANNDVFVEVSGILKANAASLIKVSKDLRLLAMLGELHLKPLQAGSSIMPGKVNPVALEAVIGCALKVKANDVLIFDAVSNGTLQINEYMPLIAFAMLESVNLLLNANKLLCEHIKDIRADERVCKELLYKSPGVVNAFLPLLGYKKIEEIINEASNEKKDVIAVIEKHLGKEVVEQVLSSENLTRTLQ
ncbi:MAG: aspartate ammonia-lyase [Endomicrobiales bacterium]|nr:aspartate ammonia-lyase [Endomicrobiales bacterium]